MLIAIPMTKEDINAKMDNKFGRASYILVYNTDTKKEEEYINNTQAMEKGCNAEAIVKYLMEKKVDAVLTMKAGSNSIKQLMNSNLKLYKAKNDNATDGVKSLLNGELEILDNTNNQL